MAIDPGSGAAGDGLRVLVTGATGNVGTSLLPKLVDAPDVDEVIGLARRVPPAASPQVTWRAVDLAVDDLESELRDVDVLVHLAWILQPSRDIDRLWDVNVRATGRLLQAAAGAGVGAIVYASSVGAYSPRPADGSQVDESWPTDGVPTSAYSMAKAYTERLLDAFEATHPDIRVARLRPGLMFQAETASHVRREFLGTLFPRGVLHRGRLPVLPRLPGLEFQVLHTDDAAEAFRRAVTGAHAGAFNLVAEPTLSLSDVAELFDARTVPVPVGAVRPAVSLAWRARLIPIDVGWFDLAVHSPTLSGLRARTELGWRPRHDARASLAELLTAIREGGGSPTPPLTPDTDHSRSAELSARQGATEMPP